MRLPIDANSLSVVEVSGITIEPLQLPEYPEPAPSHFESPWVGESDPTTWDRAELPRGACVFRLHGVKAACYPHGGTLFMNSCALLDAGPKVAPGSFYEAHPCDGVVPGCPTAQPYDTLAGYWWYLVDRGDAADLVVCAPECAGSLKYGPACAVLGPGHGPDCR